MKERPILFSGPMVQAILAGRKSVTRRLVNPQPVEVQSVTGPMWTHESLCGHFAPHVFPECFLKLGKVPFVPGQMLWVRETWARSRNNWLYRADCPPSEGPQENTDDWDWDDTIPNKWRPSIFMPRAACRLRLEVVSVRVERLQEITDVDIRLEGFSYPTPPREFRDLWDKLNPKHPWESNPFVWRVEFRKVER